MIDALRPAWLAGFLLLAVAGSGPARADYDAGLRAYERGDYATAWREFQDGAASGDHRAEFSLGTMAEQGLGMAADFERAVGHYRRAAQAGNDSAMLLLGFKHDIGEQLPRSAATAEAYYTQAAKRGNVMAKNNLAYLWGRQKVYLDEALCLSAETLRATPDEPTYLDTYGFVLFRMGRIDEAEKFFRKAHAIKRDDDIPIEHLGDIAQARGSNGEAQRLWRMARTLSRFAADRARIDRKLAGVMDFDEHPPYDARNEGFGRQCAVPTV